MKKSLLRIFLIYFSIWGAMCCVFGQYEASSDGFNEIGFPFVFLRTFAGKCLECEQLDIGFIFLGFLADLLLLSGLSLLSYYVWNIYKMIM
ncbi:hypothetical protein [Xanthocytophaga agilis]|uniref:Uncharacterized protein n=1 Tax=Xanthocytophaga agilis TaxID=3048010 RepID=A0AAE3UHU1_9BACT|nr:hypothetical protein [Xanthocytophaga agilis]MDJ1503852.1 hypothetical protein [Xanthocytophaga agilis]